MVVGASGAPDVWRRPVTWFLAVAFAGQAFGYYAVSAWLPSVLHDTLGLERAASGGAAALFQLFGMVGGIAVPIALGRRAPVAAVSAAIAVGWVALPVGLLLAPSWWPVWCTFAGVAQGGNFAVIFTVIASSRRARRPPRAACPRPCRPSATACAALGPSVLGAVHCVQRRVDRRRCSSCSAAVLTMAVASGFGAAERAPRGLTRQPTISAASSQAASSSSFSAASARSSASSAITAWWSVAWSDMRWCSVGLLVGDPGQPALDPGDLLARGAQVGGATPDAAAGACGRAGARRSGDGHRRPTRSRAQVQVLLDPAGQVAQRAVAEQRHLAVAHPLEQVPVVRDDDQRARPAVEQVLERGEGVGVEVVGRLVEQQHVGLADEQPQQLQPPALAAGQVAHGGPGALARRSRAARRAARR